MGWRDHESGIYQIQCLITNKVYTGSTVNLYYRKQEHFSALRRGNHDNSYLQRAFNKYGEENFVFEVVEKCPPNILDSREDYWNKTIPIDLRFNLRPISRSNLGLKLSDETKRKIGLAGKGRAVSQETRERISKAQIGKTITDEQRLKLARANFKPVQQIDPKTGEIIAEYESIQEANLKTGINNTRIGEVCNQRFYKGKLAGKYKWRWKDVLEK